MAAQLRAVADLSNNDALDPYTAVAQWLLPYGIQRQLRKARARRNAVRQQADEAQMAGAALDPSDRPPSRVG
jgi:hypothetical protein